MERRIIIFERERVIAEDIAETVVETFGANGGTAEVIRTTSLPETIAALAGGSAKAADLAILNATGDELRKAASALASASVEVAVVAVHEPLALADRGVENWVFLPPPFTTESLRHALKRIRP